MLKKWGVAKAESVDNKMGYPEKSEISNLEALDGKCSLRIPAVNRLIARRRVGRRHRAHRCTTSTWGRTSAPRLPRGRDFRSLSAVRVRSDPGSATPTTPANTLLRMTTSPSTTSTVLYLEGTVLVDGQVTFNEDIRYKGNGTLIANGDIIINGDVVPDTELNLAEALGLVTPGSIGDLSARIPTRTSLSRRTSPAPVSIARTTPGRSSAAGRTSSCEGLGDSPTSRASITRTCTSCTNPLLPSFLPDGMPGKGQSLLTRARGLACSRTSSDFQILAEQQVYGITCSRTVPRKGLQVCAERADKGNVRTEESRNNSRSLVVAM